MGRKGSANGASRASGLVNGVDVSDAVKESETAMFGRPKKLKKGRNRRDQSSDEDTAPLAAAKRLAATCLLYTSPSPRDVEESRMPSSA